jgi:outer membrane receptor protein involved in Fe transport
MHGRNFALTLLALLILTLTPQVWAQYTGGDIKGTVTDEEGKPLPGVNVTITSPALIGGSRTTQSNAEGVFRFATVPVGRYTVELELTGFPKVRVERVDVSLAQTSNVPVTMRLQTTAEALTVLGESPVIDVTESSLSTNYSGAILEEAPTQHSQFTLMQLSPGVTASYGDALSDRTVAFGSNQQSNAWHVDGMDLSAPETGSAWFSVNTDMVEEIQVLGVGAPAEYGNHTGAVFNVVTKKGGNDIRGSANWYILTEGLTDNNVTFEDAPEGAQTFERVEYRQILGNVGGPIVKDRVWFHGGIQTYRDAASNPGVIPELQESIPYKSDKYGGKVTARLGENSELSGFFHWEEWDSPNTLSPDYELGALTGEGGDTQAWGATWTHTRSQNFLLEAGYSGWDALDLYDSVVGNFNEDPVVDFYTPGLPYYRGGAYYPWEYKTWRSSFRGKATYYADEFLNSGHEFKFGVQYTIGDNTSVNALGVNGFYDYNYAGYYTVRYYQRPWQYGAETNEIGVFFDDSITINERLTVNVGLRFDHNEGSIPDYELLQVGSPKFTPVANITTAGGTIPGQDVVNWNVWSPRLGFVFQPTADGTSKIQGSFGVYYDHNVTGNWDFPPPGLDPLRSFRFNPDTGLFDIPHNEFLSDIVIPTDLDPPRTLQYSIGFEQQFGKDLAAGIQYVRKDTDDLIGWQILGGQYAPVIYTDPENPNNQVILFNELADPILTKGNNPGNFCDLVPEATACADGAPDYFQNYDAVLLTFEKRFSNNWALNANYTWSKSEGLIPRLLSSIQFNPFYGGTDGADPNNYTNGVGRLAGDRPHMFRVQATFFNLPLDLQAAVTADFESGKYFNRQTREGVGDVLDQGPATVILERDLRLQAVQAIDVSIARRFFFSENLAFRISGTIYNLLNSDTELAFADGSYRRGTIIVDTWTQPRRLEIGLGVDF